MSLWIKICANTTLEDARMAAEAGADALGFVFAPSPRRVTAPQVAAIVPQLPPGLEKIGVFVDAGFEEIASTVEFCGLTGVQLHLPELAAGLRERFGPQLRILGVVHFDPQLLLPEPVDRNRHLSAILVDSRTAKAVGGTGQAFDWELAARTIFHNTEGCKPRIAAGGMTPDNVAEAIRILRPWGVDVASGVESAPGRKDPAKLRAFIANARAAEQRGERR
ncbi:MAG: phosphoribosylanthranilate isomerase [Acidobacteriota bacterium]